MKILILGVNGFIGNKLVKKIMQSTGWEVYGIDLSCSKLSHSIDNPRFHFIEGDITIHKEWVDYHVKKCDVIIPLVAIATPAHYIKEPLQVFELGFEENLRIVRLCVKYGKRILFPSTSEVYGMNSDPEFSEDTSNFVFGPVRKQRWIYACAKQLLDRVIWAYGTEGKLDFTIFRPFNWIGPKLDDIDAAKEGSSRVVTQFIINIVMNEPIRLVDGGMQKRCFTYIEDGIDCLMKIIENKKGLCRGEIFNIGNPHNECSMRDLAEILLALYRNHSGSEAYSVSASEIIEVSSDEYYGEGYQDISTRKPSIKKAQKLLGWVPLVGLESALEKTLDFFIEESRTKGLLCA
ncbi:NAD-dependent epimerase/dehydratase [Candidatus Scalindua japonica]|uniref:NAD-dependent epimerase/dehydratase n=1 Tax=Candidatus Scalindua japonica TaxID=1284222 RepID=A0A286TWK8_9BACT|nr:bifunctional UDP-4-keto-pentose/UDP-xylose synthase [Candidatus Scalindua japonica]GAX60260.1 NAD-dependent epimerase/dehydratase [Candidatus Scalindua japonica]